MRELSIWYFQKIVYDTFKKFLKTNKCKDIGWLLLISLDKVVKERDEFRDSNSQLKHYVNDLRASMCALNYIPLSPVAIGLKLLKIKQWNLNLILQLAELQFELNSQASQDFYC